ncbi:MAG: V-type ATPase subunit [Candidatus Peribacteraceae bacterium]|jgi:hypothetical protein|nr:V-type ATPase subunit [Candidatus Peribacteraceae bacterium]
MPELQSLIGQQFAFASGRTGVLQQLLLTAADRDRLLGCKDLPEAERILTELKLTNPIDQGLKKADEILQAVAEWVRGEVEDMSPIAKKPTFHILWLEEDEPIISFLLKKHHGLTSDVSKEPVSGMTTYEPEALRTLVESGEQNMLPEHLATFVREIKERTDWKPEQIDAAVSQYVANLQLTLARTSGSSLIRTYVRNKIDLTNIRTALRVTDDASSLMSGGSLNLQKVLGDAEGIAKEIEKSDLPNALADAVRSGDKDQNALEMSLSKVTADDIAHMWNVPLSIEPLFAFAALAHSQLKLLRALTIGKRAGLSPQEIKQMLPPFLSASHYILS